MAVRLTNRAKKSIRDFYWRSTRKSIQRKKETKSLVDAMFTLVKNAPLIPSNENRGILRVWRNKGYSIYESTHCFIRRSSYIGLKKMDTSKNLKRKWYFACVIDAKSNTVYIVNAVFARYVDRMVDNTPTATRFLSAMKGIATKQRNQIAKQQQLTIPFHENESVINSMNQIISEVINQYLKNNLVCERNKKGLNDDEVNSKLTHLVSDLHLKGKLSQEEADTILFYGLYNNKHLQNGGRKSIN